MPVRNVGPTAKQRRSAVGARAGTRITLPGFVKCRQCLPNLLQAAPAREQKPSAVPG